MSNNTFTLLPQLALLDIQGPDSIKFLQGQVTCDIAKDASAKHLLRGAHCTHKGRMVANFDLLANTAEALRLRLPKDTLEALQASLAKYIIFSKAELSTPTDQVVGFIGATANADFEQATGLAFTSDCQVISTSNAQWLRHSDDRIEGWLTTEHELLGDLSASDRLMAEWQKADLIAGQGWITADIIEQFIPQQLNMQQEGVGGISFTKGCYTGQEIVARMHYKGKVKRAMHLFQAPQAVAMDADIYTHEGKSAGELVNTTSTDDGHWILACVAEDSLDKGVYLNADSTLPLQSLPLPYAITTEA